MPVDTIPLGRDVAYPDRYDPGLLFPIARAAGRAAIGIAAGTMPFTGHDRWHAYELSWLGPRGKPVVATATLTVPADTPHLVESKSLKLYLNSLNGARFETPEAVRARIADDLSHAAGGPVAVAFGLPPMAGDIAGQHSGVQPPSGDGAARVDGFDLDALDIAIEAHDGPQPDLLAVDGGATATETLTSALLKSNCPVTGQPDWASVRIVYTGPRIDRAGLLRYLVSYRDHAGFHEQCVERIFRDVLGRCAPVRLSVDARYTRRGGLDINPWRATPGSPVPPARRDLRQ